MVGIMSGAGRFSYLNIPFMVTTLIKLIFVFLLCIGIFEAGLDRTLVNP